MAWTNITNAQLAIGAPIRSIDLLALRDNITAQANGDAGAPKQQTLGIADNAVTAQKIKYGAGLTASGDTLIASPVSFNAVGSYALGRFTHTASASAFTVSSGSNYAAGGGSNQLQLATANAVDNTWATANTLSGTWKWLGISASWAGNPSPESGVLVGLICRVS